jgi:hypothetical protein
MDRTTKLLMTAIAAGLLWNAAMLTVKSARTDDDTDGQTLGEIARDLHALAMGTCQNWKLCGE